MRIAYRSRTLFYIVPYALHFPAELLHTNDFARLQWIDVIDVTKTFVVVKEGARKTQRRHARKHPRKHPRLQHLQPLRNGIVSRVGSLISCGVRNQLHLSFKQMQAMPDAMLGAIGCKGVTVKTRPWHCRACGTVFSSVPCVGFVTADGAAADDSASVGPG